jgi:hypothetical protein
LLNLDEGRGVLLVDCLLGVLVAYDQCGVDPREEDRGYAEDGEYRRVPLRHGGDYGYLGDKSMAGRLSSAFPP